MDLCEECGNQGMRVVVVDGTPVHECGLCGARVGERRAVESLADAEQARERGYDVIVWPLVRVLETLPGIVVRDASSGDIDQKMMPFVGLGANSEHALVQFENLAKSLLLSARDLRRHWVIELEYQRHLSFVLKPRHAGGQVSAVHVRDARADLEALRRGLERDRKLGFWRHAERGGKG